MALLGQRAYARHRAERGLPGQSLRAVQKAIESGRIPTTADGKIDPEEADRAWAERTSEEHRRGNGVREPDGPSGPSEAGELRPVPPASAAPPQQHESTPGGNGREEQPAAATSSFAKAAAVEKAYKAQLAKLDYEERMGRLIPADSVLAQWQKIITASRNRMLAIPSKLRSRAPHLTGEDIALIEALLREGLDELADGALPY